MNKGAFKRILIINVNWMGDVLFSTPFIRSLRENFPESFIAVAVVPRCAEVLRLNPDINEIIEFDERSLHRGLIGKLRLINTLKKYNFDICFLLHGSFTRALIAFLAGIPERIGYSTKKRKALLTKAIEPWQDMHKVEYFLDILRPLGIEVKNTDYRFCISDEDRAYADKLLKSQGIDPLRQEIFIINPGGNWDLKRWPKENFVRLAELISTAYNGAAVLITGAPKDSDLAADIQKACKSKIYNFTAKTTIKQLAALFEKAKAVVANDSGPMHIAVAMLAPTVALFGPTSPKITGPYGKGRYIVLQKDTGCQVPCYKLNCKDNKCMKAITPEEVLKAIKKLIGS